MGWFDHEYKIEAIKTLIDRKKYEDALELADEVNWKRVKDVKMICMVSDIYKLNKRYEDCRDLLLMAEVKHPSEKTIISSLCEMHIRLGEMEEAEERYREYIELAPEDANCLVLKYKLATANKADAEERIAILEELKEQKRSAKWLYELAKLYLTAGKKDKCKKQCEEIFELFGDSKFAAKAMELKNKVG